MVRVGSGDRGREGTLGCSALVGTRRGNASASDRCSASRSRACIVWALGRSGEGWTSSCSTRTKARANMALIFACASSTSGGCTSTLGGAVGLHLGGAIGRTVGVIGEGQRLGSRLRGSGVDRKAAPRPVVALSDGSSSNARREIGGPETERRGTSGGRLDGWGTDGCGS